MVMISSPCTLLKWNREQEQRQIKFNVIVIMKYKTKCSIICNFFFK